ncbi:MAG: purine-nucleoside phosphorylase [Epsilonproteobacteria bacterium]|nr:purine-nucleoside phosphorylase [Campylobacterota bacterium]NPA56949.1 purine-nucleoside phosphorylase [Campylobacterota bacterium]
MIVSAGRGEEFDFALPIGVGLVEATINLTRLVLLDRPDFLLFVGSAGSYGEFQIGDIVESRGATQIERSLWEGCGYTPLDNAIVSEGLEIGHQTLVNSSNYITSCPDYNGEFLKRGIGLENMEFFALMKVAQEYAIPAGGIFVVTNFCDERAHESYRAHLPRGLELLRSYVKRRVKGI